MHDDDVCIGHVIRIIDEYTLIIDVGKNFISLNKRIQVYAPGDQLYDLSGKKLSKYIHVKNTLKVIDVQSDYSVCRKLKTVKRKPGFPLVLSPLLESEEECETPEVLNVEKSEIQRLTPVDLKIHVGDLIKLA